MPPDTALVIVLPYATPSQNETRKWHWAKTRKLRSSVAMAATCAMRQHGLPAGYRAQARMRVEVVRHNRRALDYGNLVGGFKLFLDGLVDAGALYDDAPRWCEEHYAQAYAERPCTVITVRAAA